MKKIECPRFEVEIIKINPQKNNNKKERMQQLFIGDEVFFEDTPDDIGTLKVAFETDRINLYDENDEHIGTASVIQSMIYERDEKSEKVINYLPSSQYGDVNLILDQYDKMLVIDTNSKEINGELISVTAVIQSVGQRENRIAFSQNYMVWNNPNIPLEQRESFAWAKLLYSAYLQMLDKEILDTVVIVDSHLGNIDDYNDRVLPLFGNFYLPECFTLGYASADVGGEYLPNQLMRMCDKLAQKVFKECL